MIEFITCHQIIHIPVSWLLQQKGMSELEKGAALEKSMRGPLCSMALLSYHTVVTYVLGETLTQDVVIWTIDSHNL